MLQSLAGSAEGNGPGKGIPITLFLHGGMLAGHICSPQEFFRAMAAIYRDGFSTFEGGLAEWADSFATAMFEDSADEVDAELEKEDRGFEESGTKTARWALTRNVYLTNVRYTTLGQPSLEREHVCVKLTQVVGWTFGITAWQAAH